MISLIAVSLLCILVVIIISYGPLIDDNTETQSPVHYKKPESIPVDQLKAVPEAQQRRQYLDALSEYENTLKPELAKIDLPTWNKERSDQLAQLKDAALSEFTAGDYVSATSTIEQHNQLAQTTITDSHQALQQALSNARKAYESDQYDEAKLQVQQALMLDNTSVSAATLVAKIDKLPEILGLLEKVKTARVENNPHKELKLIKELIRMAPDRTESVKRKQVLVNSINQSNFNAAIAQSYQALKRENVEIAQQQINSAKKIFPHRREIADVTLAIQALAKKQRLSRYQQDIELAIKSDNWPSVKNQATLALQEHDNNKAIQESLAQATSIIALSNTFDESLNHPYRLANQQLVSKLQNKFKKASSFSSISPSLSKKAEKLSRLIQAMNHKIQVNVNSDNQTTILVRGVGTIGETELKTLHLLPGQYTFEGKRKGYKSKLIQVLIPYDTTSFHLDIRCDEPI